MAKVLIVERPPSTAASPTGEPVTFARAQAIVQQRCVPCHSSRPTQPGFASAPKGVAFDTPQQIAVRAAQIREQAVELKAMPLGNLTHMTQDERDELGAWIAQGARLR
jgi:uncharacterized membrane protein